jgi:hypothetical protein
MNGGTINKSGDYFAIVNGGWNGVGARTGVVNQVNGIINCQSECWVGDAGGAGNGSLGIYNLSGGSLTLGSWFGIGRDGSTGIFNMTGGTLSKAAGGDMVIGRGGSSGTFTMSAGTINKDPGNPIIVGQGQGVGEFDFSGGTLNSGAEFWLGVDNGTIATNNISGPAVFNLTNWMSIGRGGLGVMNFYGGAINKTGGGNFIVGDGGTGFFYQTNGTLNINSEFWIAQSGSGIGQVDLLGGAVTNNSWLAIGREGGQGTLNIAGGSMTKTGGGNISITHGGGASGTVNQTGGSFLVGNTGDTANTGGAFAVTCPVICAAADPCEVVPCEALCRNRLGNPRIPRARHRRKLDDTQYRSAASCRRRAPGGQGRWRWIRPRSWPPSCRGGSCPSAWLTPSP